MTFVDRLETKLMLGASAAAGAFLRENGFRMPTAKERMEFDRIALPSIVKMVADAEPTESSPLELFNGLLERVVVLAVGTIATVMQLQPPASAPMAQA